MTNFRNALGFTIVLAMASAPVLAATKATVATKTAAAKPAAKPAPVRVAAKSAGRMVTTKTSTGKTVTYNCSLAGNATKTACKS